MLRRKSVFLLFTLVSLVQDLKYGRNPGIGFSEPEVERGEKQGSQLGSHAVLGGRTWTGQGQSQVKERMRLCMEPGSVVSRGRQLMGNY